MAENYKQSYQPIESQITPDDIEAARQAVNLIRNKVERVYAQEPEIRQELAEAKAVRYRSRHQQFMYELSGSGKDLAAIQTEWHNYYKSLPDAEKHQVWQEFYESQASVTGQPKTVATNPQAYATHKHQAAKTQTIQDLRTAKDIRKAIRNKVSANGALTTKHHFQSLLFGLSMGFVSIIILLFGFFNEIIITPFIQPSRTALATPIIVNNAVPANATPEVIIPKVNAEIPVNYAETSNVEANIENDLQNGVVHYPTTALPGQNGNAVYFGHSSSNILNKGKFKFAFLFLHKLVLDDTFYLTYSGKIYVYKVISRTIVEPTDVSVLYPVSGQIATATLITCDPPGTSAHRLIVVGQQISPDPATNSAANQITSPPAQLPGNGPTLWARLTSTLQGKAAVLIFCIGAILYTFKWMTKPRY